MTAGDTVIGRFTTVKPALDARHRPTQHHVARKTMRDQTTTREAQLALALAH